MSINGGRLVLAGLLGSMLAVTPVLAESGHGSGGHASGGHAAGGAHGAAGGAHYAPGAHYAAGRGYAGGGAVAHSYGGGYRGSAYVGRGAYGYPGGYYRHGYSTGAYWGGGYWRGGYWPRAYYGLGFAWFLPILPGVYATYWYGGIPYYYANDVYYTWDPGYSGYVATDPPPVADSGGAGMATAPGAPTPEAGSGDGQYQGQQDQSQAQQAAGSAPQIFMYPKNGQSEQQQSTDKRECQQWAANQAGQGGENSSDYRRALVACVEGRGYSAN